LADPKPAHAVVLTQVHADLLQELVAAMAKRTGTREGTGGSAKGPLFGGHTPQR